MILVTIDRASVKRNPNAGNQVTYVPLGRFMTFETNAPIPDWLKESVTEWHNVEVCDGIIAATNRSGTIYEPDLIDKFYDWAREQGVKGFMTKADLQMPRQQIFHRPEPTWLYDFIDPNITCKKCNSTIKVSDIEVEWDGEEHEVCPKCNKCNTFEEREFEDIDDVVKELNL